MNVALVNAALALSGVEVKHKSFAERMMDAHKYDLLLSVRNIRLHDDYGVAIAEILNKGNDKLKELEMKIFDPTKPCQTRDGRKVEIIKVLDKPLENNETIVGIIENRAVKTWRSNGQYLECHSHYDLVNISQKHVRWVNVYAGLGCYAHNSKVEADREGVRSGERIACIKIEFEEGEGL